MSFALRLRVGPVFRTVRHNSYAMRMQATAPRDKRGPRSVGPRARSSRFGDWPHPRPSAAAALRRPTADEYLEEREKADLHVANRGLTPQAGLRSARRSYTTEGKLYD